MDMHPSEASIRQLRYFVVLAGELHFGRAAERLGISQPSLSRQIQALEKIIGTPLVMRTQRGVTLSAAGQAFLESAGSALASHDRALETARNVGERSGEALAIGFACCAPYHDFPDVVQRFIAQYPRTRFSTFEMTSEEQAEAILTKRIDIGFLHPPIPSGDQFEFDKICDERFVAGLPATHRLARRRRVRCSELASEDFVLYPRSVAPGCYDAVQRICREAGFTPRVVHESNAMSVSLGLVPVAKVVSLYPASVRNRRVPGVVFRELEGSLTTVECGFLRLRGKPSPQADRFLKMWRSLKAQ